MPLPIPIAQKEHPEGKVMVRGVLKKRLGVGHHAPQPLGFVSAGTSGEQLASSLPLKERSPDNQAIILFQNFRPFLCNFSIFQHFFLFFLFFAFFFCACLHDFPNFFEHICPFCL